MSSVWHIDERVCLDILHSECELSKENRHDIFGRIFGQRWKDEGRKPYTVARLYEEVSLQQLSTHIKC